MINNSVTDNKMHRIFGIKENFLYSDREGAYLIPLRNKQVGVVQTSKGYFFLGGGLKSGDNHLDCIERECIEEVGCSSCVEGRLCSAEVYTKHPIIGYFHPIQTYYFGKLLNKEYVPTEEDHVLCWIEYNRLRGKMYLEMQNWALEQLLDIVG